MCTLAHHCEIDRLSSVWPTLHDTVYMEIGSMRNASSIAFCVLLMNEYHLFTTLTVPSLCKTGKLKILKESVVRVHWVWKTLFASDTINEPYLIKALSFCCKSNRNEGRTMVEASSTNDQNIENIKSTKGTGKFSSWITRVIERTLHQHCFKRWETVRSLIVHFLAVECLLGTALMNSRIFDVKVNFPSLQCPI